MATTKSFFEYIADSFSFLPEVSFRPMMGEYILYYKGKVIGGIYDDRLLVKPTPSAKRFLPCASLEIPYSGAKGMLLVEEIENRDLIASLFAAIATEVR